MSTTSTITIAASNAFIDTCEVPPTGSGPLDGLRFAVKDLIDVAGMKTGCGNPSWRDAHPPAVAHAVCVEQLLRAGARCVGKTILDELAFSLLGENHFYGTPLNPAAPDRVPGGSSSGSASAVACGLVDFALGTDTGGSVRVPASNCGIYGFRPSHGFISVAGVNPFAPTFDTVGIFARDVEVLARVASVLLAWEPAAAEPPATVHLLREAFELADPEIQQALVEPVRWLKAQFGDRFREISLHDIDGDEPVVDLSAWCDTYCVLQWAEIRSSLGAWIADAKPNLGPTIAASFELTTQLDRRRVAEAIARREHYYRCLQRFLGPHDLICMPTAPTPAPLKGQSARAGFERQRLLPPCPGTDQYRRHRPPAASVAAAGHVGRAARRFVPAGRARPGCLLTGSGETPWPRRIMLCP